jgi:hypothetical protein
MEKPFPKVSPWNSMEDKRENTPNKHYPAPKVGF